MEQMNIIFFGQTPSLAYISRFAIDLESSSIISKPFSDKPNSIFLGF